MNDNFFKDLEDKSIIKNNNIDNNTKKDNKEDKKTKKRRRKRKNEEDKVKVISISLQNKVLDKVKEEAEKEDLHVSQFINKILKNYFKEKGI